MHRQHSLQPFSRHYSHSTNPFLDFLEVETDKDPEQAPELTPDAKGIDPQQGTSSGGSHRAGKQPSVPRITVQQEQRERLLETLQDYRSSAETLHTITFVSVHDYLFLLRAVSRAMRAAGRQGMYYLAAAVSDFFVPREKMSEHKIQSGKGSLLIEMAQVPKVLKPMVDEWASEGYVVSFKLETEPRLLVPKARAALERYGHQLVIGNDLNSRKYEVAFISRTADDVGSDGGNTAPRDPRFEVQSDSRFREEWLYLREGDLEIEKDIVDSLVKRHQRWLEAGTKR